MIPRLSRAKVALSIAIILLASQSFIIVARGDYSIAISSSSVSVTINTTFYQNLTGSPQGYNLSVIGSNASSAEAAFSSALGKLAPGAKVSGLHLTSSSSGNTTETMANFNVNGVSRSSGDALMFNLAWKSFKIEDAIQVGNRSLNAVGQYLATSPFLNRGSSSVITWNYLEDGKPITQAQSVEAASSFYLFDFSQLSTHVSSWSAKFSADKSETVLSNNVNHNITARETIKEAETPFRIAFIAGYVHKVKITIAGFPRIIGDTIVIEANNVTTLTMLTLCTALPVVGLTTYLSERRISKKSRGGAKKKVRP